jgi:hypothetical protein
VVHKGVVVHVISPLRDLLTFHVVHRGKKIFKKKICSIFVWYTAVIFLWLFLCVVHRGDFSVAFFVRGAPR